MFTFEQYVIVVVALMNAAIALYIFLQKPRSTLHRAFLFFGIGAALWGGGIGLLSPATLIHIEKWIFLGGGMMSVSFFMLSCLLARRDHLSWPEFIAAALFIASFAGIPFGLYVTGTAATATGKHVAAVFGPYGELYLGAIFIYMIAGLLRLVVTSRSLERLHRRPVYYFLLGASVFIACMALFDIALPIFGIADFNFLGPLSLFAFVGITAYAIVRHRLLDIRIVIQRGLIYSALVSLIVALYIFVIHIFDFVLDRDDGIIFGAGISTTLISIFGAPLIEQYFRKVTDKFFFKERYDYALALRSLSEILHTSTDFDELIERMQKTLAEILRASSAQILLHDEQQINLPEDILEPDPSERKNLYGRIRLDTKEIGTVLIGPKRSGDRYTEEDVQLLQTFSLQAATALARARLFKQVQEYAAELENKVDSRTEELRRVQESQKQMMLDIAHNVQTPLTVFQARLENARHLPQGKIDIDMLERSLMSLSDFISDLLKLAELENRISNAPMKLTSLSLILEDIAEEVSTIAAAREIEIVRDMKPDIFVLADAKELRAAIMNLAGNAIKYMSLTGKREITFGLERNGTEARLQVRDTGIGIASKDLPQIFDRFYRPGTTGDIGGSGLGLAISKQIIERHGGRLIAESSLDRGTTMTIFIPTIKRTHSGA